MAEFHFDNRTVPAGDLSIPWWRELTRYHWLVMTVASLGWLFDCLDQQLFVMVRQPAMRALMPHLDSNGVDVWSNYATAIFVLGWATGGLIFGVMGDRIGRVKTMLITILLYSLFTGLSALSTSFWDFGLYRFLTGLGVGGEFAVGVALVAEAMPDRARPYCLTLLQMLSTVGNIGAAFINMGMGKLQMHGLESPWRVVFLIGTLPALLVVVIMSRLHEPERWTKASHEGAVAKQLGSYRELFRNPRWRKNALLGLLLAFSGVVGLWGVGFFTPDLVGSVLEERIVVQTYDDRARELSATGADAQRLADLTAVRDLVLQDGKLRKDKQPVPESLKATKTEMDNLTGGWMTIWRSIAGVMLQLGACFGMFSFGFFAQRMGRRPTFAICFVAAWVSTAAVFWYLNDFSQIFWLVPIMGICQLSVFAGYAIYFPELFPTYLRSTGTSFCYNVGRFVAAGAIFGKGAILGLFSDKAEPFRYAGVAMSFVLLAALLALPFLPETKGKPLPE